MGDEFRIDAEKMSLHPARVAAWLEAKDDWSRAKGVFPLYVEVSPVGYCNHECTFCGVDYMLDRPDKPRLSLEVLTRMLTDMAANGVRSVMFAGAGEPLLHKELAEAIVHADSVGLDTAITTNGTLLTESFLRKVLVVPRLRWIKVSINGGDQATFEAIHRAKSGDFERVLENLARASGMKRELGSSCTLGAQMVALPESETTERARPLVRQKVPSNFHTAAPLALRLRDAKIDYFVVKPYSQHLMSERTRAYGDVTYQDERAWGRPLEAIGTDDFRVIVRYQTMAGLVASDRGYRMCHATPFHWAYVEADGNVWGCSAYLGRTTSEGTHGDDRFRFGNVHEASFSEIWQGERRRACFEYVRDGLDISECRINCRMHHVNRYLDQVADPGPHGSFI